MKWQCSAPVPSRITPLMQGSSDRSLPLQDDAERQRCGTKARPSPKPCHKAATDAHSNITILVRVPHHTPTAPRHGCMVKPPCNHSTQKAPAEGVRKGKILKLKVIPKITNHMQASFRRPYQALILHEQEIHGLCSLCGYALYENA